MLNHVLVPLDGSSLSEEALDYALQIVNSQGKLTLVAAIDLPDVLPYSYYPVFTAPAVTLPLEGDKDYEQTLNRLVQEAKTYLQRVIDRLHETMPDLTIETFVEVEEPAVYVVQVAERVKSEVIVISTHGRSGLSRWLFGSVTTKVLEAAPCPVLVVPSATKRAERRNSLARHTVTA